MRFFPLLDNLTLEESKRFGVKPFTYLSSIGKCMGSIKAVATGEKRPPKKGEWFLSGAIIGAYRAPNDFLPSMVYQIAKLVETETITIIREKQ